MLIRVEEHWHYEGNTASRARRVYRDALLIGRVRRWREIVEVGAPYREWFTAERWKDEAFVPIAGQQPDFEEALQRLVLYDVAN